MHLRPLIAAVVALTIYLIGGGLSRGQGIESTTISIDQLSDQTTSNAQTASQSGDAQASTPSGSRILETANITEAMLRAAIERTSTTTLRSLSINPAVREHPENLSKDRLYDIGTDLGVVLPDLKDYIYSGFGKKDLPLITSSDWYTRETFNDKNSFLGTGVVDTFGTDTGVDVTNRYGLTFNPDFGYKYAARDLSAPNAMYSDGYVGQLNFSQRVFPMVAISAGQPNATYNLREATIDDLKKKAYDIYPNFAINLGLTTQFTALDSTTLTKGNRVKGTQNSWDIAPNMSFQFNITKDYSIQLQPTWDDTMTSNSADQSASGGTMQIQVRNQYTRKLETVSRSVDDSIPPLVTQSLILTQYNGLYHDTNQEPLPTAPHAVFQNWANFGVTAIYKKMYNSDITHPQYLQIRLDYSYQAFNAAYEGHTLVASLNLDF